MVVAAQSCYSMWLSAFRSQRNAKGIPLPDSAPSPPPFDSRWGSNKCSLCVVDPIEIVMWYPTRGRARARLRAEAWLGNSIVCRDPISRHGTIRGGWGKLRGCSGSISNSCDHVVPPDELRGLHRLVKWLRAYNGSIGKPVVDYCEVLLRFAFAAGSCVVRLLVGARYLPKIQLCCICRTACTHVSGSITCRKTGLTCDVSVLWGGVTHESRPRARGWSQLLLPDVWRIVQGGNGAWWT